MTLKIIQVKGLYKRMIDCVELFQEVQQGQI